MTDEQAHGDVCGIGMLEQEHAELVEENTKLGALILRGYEAMKGAQVLAQCYFDAQHRDPYNNTNYCNIADWIRDVEVQLELKEPALTSRSMGEGKASNNAERRN